MGMVGLLTGVSDPLIPSIGKPRQLAVSGGGGCGGRGSCKVEVW